VEQFATWGALLKRALPRSSSTTGYLNAEDTRSQWIMKPHAERAAIFSGLSETNEPRQTPLRRNAALGRAEAKELVS
jgi:hypothetical protein